MKKKNVEKETPLNCNRKSGFKCLIGVFIFFWPLIYLFHHILPINGQHTAMGNDFILLYYKYKVYLLACLAEFKFPLWSPSEGCGFPFYINPFAQVFYPLNLPLVLWYKISGGYNPIDHQFFAIIGISIFALGLYKWLRLINKNMRAVVLSTIIISVSFKITEILRFPNAVHTAAWYPWILYAITKIFKSQSVKDSLLGGATLVFSIICLCTGGYPYYVYYSQFLFVPYFLIFLIRPFRRYLFNIDSIKWKNAVLTFAVCAIITALICGPYLLSIKNLMSQTIDRAGKDFGYSTEHVFDFTDTIGSLVWPPTAQVEGWYFFSITALLIILLYLFTKSTGRFSSDTHFSGGIAAKVFFVLWIGVISYITYNKHSYLFIFLWKYMPGFSSLRVWGRLNIILLPILAWLLSLAFNHFENLIFDSIRIESKSFWKKNQAILTLILIYVVILAVQLYLILNKMYDYYWQEYLQNVSGYNVWFLYTGIAAFAVILSILAVSKKRALVSNKASALVAFLLITAAVFEMWPVGTHTWTYTAKSLRGRINPDVDMINRASFEYPRKNYMNSISLDPVFNVSILPNWYFGRYVKFLKESFDDIEALNVLLGVTGKQKVFFSESIDYKTVRDFLTDALRYKNHGFLLSYTGDELEWKIDAPAAGYLSFIDNWDSNWKVFVDGEENKIELLFGTFKSVAVKRGGHLIKFTYEPGLLYR
ncbi:MAG: hypothetical protein NTW93_02695 [Phycisphaerae bacterium]|nr:hypothetical protein [Phycisphaerae bacterium]